MAARGVSLLALCALLPAASGDSASSCAQKDDAAQCAALAAIYESTNGKEWTRSAGWLKGGSYCGWEGVTCAGRDVQALNLTKNGLTGELHAGIAALQGRNGIYFAGAHVVPGMGLLEQACAAGDAAADGVVRSLRAGGFEC